MHVGHVLLLDGDSGWSSIGSSFGCPEGDSAELGIPISGGFEVYRM